MPHVSTIFSLKYGIFKEKIKQTFKDEGCFDVYIADCCQNNLAYKKPISPDNSYANMSMLVEVPFLFSGVGYP